MRWAIRADELAGVAALSAPPVLTDEDRRRGVVGPLLFYGFGDFFDALQPFCSNGILGLGIGNVNRNYPLFGIPRLRFEIT